MDDESIRLTSLQASILLAKPINQQQILVGCLVVFLCALLFAKERWFLENTKKGKLLISWFGADFAPTVLRGLILLGVVFGVLLAVDVIRPIQWR